MSPGERFWGSAAGQVVDLLVRYSREDRLAILDAVTSWVRTAPDHASVECGSTGPAARGPGEK